MTLCNEDILSVINFDEKKNKVQYNELAFNNFIPETIDISDSYPKYIYYICIENCIFE